MPEFVYEDIVAAFPCMAAAPSSGWRAKGVSIDSRSLKPGELFFAIRGENHDGHDYVDAAFASGAAGAVISRERRDILNRHFASGAAIFLSDDPLIALQRLARFHRSRMSGPVFGVTGSSGKTTAKEMLLAMLSSMGVRAYGTRGNLNNHIGLPLTLLSIPRDAGAVVLEMGMNHPGEISLLSGIAGPDYAIITSVSEAHMEFFNSVQEIVRAKLEITDGMREGSPVVYSAASPGSVDAARLCAEKNLRFIPYAFEDVPIASDLSVTVSIARALQCDLNGIHFEYGGSKIQNANYFNGAMAQNLFGALLLLREAGYPMDAVVKSASDARPTTPGRFQLYRKREGERIRIMVDDTYNANPDSFCRAIEALGELLPDKRLLLIAGEMAELGSYALAGHIRVGDYAVRMGFDSIAAVGGESAEALIGACRKSANCHGSHFDNNKEFISQMEKWIDDVDGILVKGSRRARMEEVCEAIRNRGYV